LAINDYERRPTSNCARRRKDLEHHARDGRRVVALRFSQDQVEWLCRLADLASSADNRSRVSELIVAGPLDDMNDDGESVASDRRRHLSSIVLEAALAEQHNDLQQGVLQSFSAQGARSTLKDWVLIGLHRGVPHDAPLSRIAQMIDADVGDANDAIVTRLGLVVPFWASLCFVRALASRARRCPLSRRPFV